MSTVPSAFSTPVLTLSATVGEVVSGRRRERERCRRTFANMAVEGVDDYGNSWSRHFSGLWVRREDGGSLGVVVGIFILRSIERPERLRSFNRISRISSSTMITEPPFFFRLFHPRSILSRGKTSHIRHLKAVHAAQ